MYLSVWKMPLHSEDRRSQLKLQRSLRHLGAGQPLDSAVQGHTAETTAVSFTADAKHLVSSSKDNSLRVWDVSSGASAFQPEAVHASLVPSLVTRHA